MKHFILGLVLVSIADPAYAIPPPDLLAILQPIAHIIGFIAIVIAGSFHFLRDKIKSLVSKKVGIIFLILGIVALGIWYGIKEEKDLTLEPEYLTIEAVIARDNDSYTRDWKKELLPKMTSELASYRILQDLVPLEHRILPSYKPSQILAKMEEEDVFFLDVRESRETRYWKPQGNLKYYRYGDIVNDNVPDIPKDTQLIMLCYSGVRGYISGLLLAQNGFTNISYIQGGLDAWIKQDFPWSKDLKSPEYKRMSSEFASGFEGERITFVERRIERQIMKNSPISPDSMTSEEIQNKIQSVPPEIDLLLVCSSYTTCYDAENFAFLAEGLDRTVVGIYDTSQ